MWHLFCGNSENNMIMQFWTDILRKWQKKTILQKKIYTCIQKKK